MGVNGVVLLLQSSLWLMVGSVGCATLDQLAEGNSNPQWPGVLRAPARKWLVTES